MRIAAAKVMLIAGVLAGGLSIGGCECRQQANKGKVDVDVDTPGGNFRLDLEYPKSDEKDKEPDREND